MAATSQTLSGPFLDEMKLVYMKWKIIETILRGFRVVCRGGHNAEAFFFAFNSHTQTEQTKTITTIKRCKNSDRCVQLHALLQDCHLKVSRSDANDRRRPIALAKHVTSRHF